MTLPNLPEGARLALLNWPGGQPTVDQICRAAVDGGYTGTDPASDIFCPLIEAALIQDVPDVPIGHLRCFRLTQTGRKAVDVLQSGVE